MNEKEAREIEKQYRSSFDLRYQFELKPKLMEAVGYLEAIEKSKGLVEALKLLHDNTKNYVEINNLGDPYHNQDMQMAKDALAKFEAEK